MDISSFLETHLGTIEGWCDKDKAMKLYELITEIKPSLCVEIGVFGGSSLLPQALALKHNNKGVIVGIDPWSNSCAIEAMENAANKNWWGNVNLDAVYDKFLDKLKLYEVKDFVQIHRNKSSEVVNRFDNNIFHETMLIVKVILSWKVIEVSIGSHVSLPRTEEVLDKQSLSQAR